MSIRDLQREVTRARILGAVLDLVAEGRGNEISVPDVARRSRVSLATIYRYFPTKDALLDAAADEPSMRAAGVPLGSAPDGPAYLHALWSSFADRLPLIRRQTASEAGRAMRSRRLGTSRAWFEERVARAGITVESPEGARLVRLCLLLTSSLAFLELHDRQGMPPDDAAADVEWAVGALERATAAAEGNT